MRRYYEGSYTWLGSLSASSNGHLYRLLAPLLEVVQSTWPEDPEHLAYAARSTALGLLGDEAAADRIGLAAYACNVGMIGWARAPDREARRAHARGAPDDAAAPRPGRPPVRALAGA